MSVYRCRHVCQCLGGQLFLQVFRLEYGLRLEPRKSGSIVIGLKEDSRQITLEADNSIIKIEPFFELLNAIAGTVPQLVPVNDKMPADKSGLPLNECQKIKEGDLYALLSICSNEDLAPLVETISGARTLINSFTTSPEYKEFYPNHERYYKKIADEIRLFCGGHSIRNVFRGEGPSYREVLKDVCEKLKVKYSSDKIPLIEEALLTACLKHQVGIIFTHEEREKMRADAAGRSQRPDLKLAFESAHLFHHLATGHLGTCRNQNFALNSRYCLSNNRPMRPASGISSPQTPQWRHNPG